MQWIAPQKLMRRDGNTNMGTLSISISWRSPSTIYTKTNT